MVTQTAPLHVSIIATPDAQVTPLSGLYETFGAFGLLANFEPDVPEKPFEVEIVAPSAAPISGASGLPLGPNRACAEIERTDIVIVPLMMVKNAQWIPGRYPELVDWLRRMYRQGATLCSTCTGALLMAETGLLDGHDATIHWAFAPTFKANFPRVHLRTAEVLVTAGKQDEFIMTGGVTSWHDLVLYLIAEHIGADVARGMARLMMLEWHGEGQAPYISFAPRFDHGDGLIVELQTWLGGHFSHTEPLRALLDMAALPRRSLERRFAKATGSSPLAYVQALRIEEAKRRLERSDAPIDQISFDVGYENAAFFRRLFKRATRLTPGSYRRKFQVPPG